MYINSSDSKEIDRLAEFLKENPKKFVMISSDNLVETLNVFADRYSGKKGEVGDIKEIDSKTNQGFENMKSRIIPLMQDTTNYSKVEYLGYENIMILPDFQNHTVKEIKDFISDNKPYGMVINIDNGLWQKEFAENAGLSKVYAYSEEGIRWIDKLNLKANRVYGIVE